MIRITNTPNVTGVTVSGDHDDLDALVHALYDLTVSDFDSNLTKQDRRYLNIVYDRTTDVVGITHPFVDEWNLRYLDLTPEARTKKLVTITKRFAEYAWDADNLTYRRAIDRAVAENGWEEQDLRFPGLKYPDLIDW